jgi:hypothetical protein
MKNYKEEGQLDMFSEPVKKETPKPIVGFDFNEPIIEKKEPTEPIALLYKKPLEPKVDTDYVDAEGKCTWTYVPPEFPKTTQLTGNALIPMNESETELFYGWYDSVRTHAVGLGLWLNIPKERNLSTTDIDDMTIIFRSFNHSPMVLKALDNYKEMFSSKKYDITGYNYGTLKGFIKNGVPLFVDSARPLETFLKNERTGELTLDELKAQALENKMDVNEKELEPVQEIGFQLDIQPEVQPIVSEPLVIQADVVPMVGNKIEKVEKAILQIAPSTDTPIFSKRFAELAEELEPKDSKQTFDPKEVFDCMNWYDRVSYEANTMGVWNEKQPHGAELEHNFVCVMLPSFRKNPSYLTAKKALQNYMEIKTETDKYELKGKIYPDLIAFMRTGVELFKDGALPFKEFRKKEPRSATKPTVEIL